MYEAFNAYILKVFYALKNEVNGCVRYKSYPQMDAVIYNVKFKDYIFECPVNNIQEKIHSNISVEEVIADIKEEYKRALLCTFFKTNNRKSRDIERVGGNR